MSQPFFSHGFLSCHTQQTKRKKGTTRSLCAVIKKITYNFIIFEEVLRHISEMVLISFYCIKYLMLLWFDCGTCYSKQYEVQ